jgi:hypothetical protein
LDIGPLGVNYLCINLNKFIGGGHKNGTFSVFNQSLWPGFLHSYAGFNLESQPANFFSRMARCQGGYTAHAWSGTQLAKIMCEVELRWQVFPTKSGYDDEL